MCLNHRHVDWSSKKQSFGGMEKEEGIRTRKVDAIGVLFSAMFLRASFLHSFFGYNHFLLHSYDQSRLFYVQLGSYWLGR